MEFVEQHRADILHLGIVQDAPREQAVGDHLNPRGGRNFPVHPCGETHRLAEPFPEGRRHALCGHPRRDPARLEHQDAAADNGVAAEQARQRERHARRLAGARRRGEDEPVASRKRAENLRQHVVYRQGILRGDHRARNRAPGAHLASIAPQRLFSGVPAPTLPSLAEQRGGG